METPTRRQRRKRTQKDEQREATRARLLEAARTLFGQFGYDDVSVTEIAREAGVTHGTIHAHFHAKAGLLYALITESNDLQIAAARAALEVEGPVLDRLAALVSIWVGHDLADPKVLAAMQAYYWQWPPETEAENRAQLEDALQVAREMLAAGVAGGELRSDLDLDRMLGVLYAVYTQGLRPALYEGASRADCEREIVERFRLIVEGARA